MKLRFIPLLLVILFTISACGVPDKEKTSDKLSTDATLATTQIETGEISDLWYLTRGNSKLDQGWTVDVDNQGNIYFGTHQQNPSQLFTDAIVYKFSQDGQELWSTRWGNQFQQKTFIVATDEAYVYVGGTTYSSGSDLMAGDMFVIALDANSGNLAWEFTWGQGFGYEEVDGLIVDETGIYISGWTTGKTSSSDIAILKLSKQGQLEWVSTWGSDRWDQADGQMVMDSDSIYICGRYDADNIALGGTALLAKFNKTNGSYIEHVTWGGLLFNDSLGMTSDGKNLYSVGLTLGYGNGGQIFILDYDKNLNLKWQQLWGGEKAETARSVVINPEGNILVGGQSNSYGSGKNDIVLLEYTPDGKLNWSQIWGGPENDAVLGMAMYNWILYLSGNTESWGGGAEDAILVKVNARSGIMPDLKDVK